MVVVKVLMLRQCKMLIVVHYTSLSLGGVGVATTNMELEAISNSSCNSVWCINLSLDPETAWHIGLSTATFVSQNVTIVLF